MKKILGISLCALFAVSAANADIASTQWVNQQVGGMDAAATSGQYVTVVSQTDGKVSATGANFATSVADGGTIAPTSAAVADHVEGAINALDVNTTTGDFVTRILQANGKIEAGSGSFAGDVTTGGATAPTSAAVKTYVDGKVSDLEVGTLEERVSTNETNITANETKIDEHTAAIQDMDFGPTTGQYVTVVSQADGKVTATGADFADAVTVDGTNAPKSSAVVTYVRDNAVQDVEPGTVNGTINVDGEDVAVKGLGSAAYTEASAYASASLTQTVSTNTARISENAGKIDTNTQAINTNKQSINNNATAISALDGRVGVNETDIDALQESVNGLGALAHESTVTTDFITAQAVTSAKIADGAVTTTQIAGNTITDANIATNARIANTKIAFTDPQAAALSSGITSDLVADINSNRANLNAMLGEDTGYSDCKNSGDGCTLVVRNGTFSWEAVTREAQ